MKKAKIDYIKGKGFYECPCGYTELIEPDADVKQVIRNHVYSDHKVIVHGFVEDL